MYKKYSTFWSFSFFLLFALTFLVFPSTDKQERIKEQQDISETGSPCECAIQVSTNSGINFVRIKQGNTTLYTGSANGSQSGLFTVSAPYTYSVYWESVFGGGAQIDIECCQLSCQSERVTVPSDVEVHVMDFSTTGCGTLNNCVPTCW